MDRPALTVAIVDDEALGRDKLRDLLAREPQIEIVAECSDGVQAVEQIRAKRPDIVFLDVQMPHLDGFEVLEALEGEHDSTVVFVTAFDAFALRAFDANAVDYLLKPFDQARFAAALRRARRAAYNREREASADLLSSFVREIRAQRGYATRLLVKVEERFEFVATSDLLWLEAADNYVVLHTRKQQRFTLRESLQSLQGRLDPASFLRISRSAIISIDAIKSIRPWSGAEYLIALSNGVEMLTGRSYKAQVRAVLFT